VPTMLAHTGFACDRQSASHTEGLTGIYCEFQAPGPEVLCFDILLSELRSGAHASATLTETCASECCVRGGHPTAEQQLHHSPDEGRIPTSSGLPAVEETQR
jgi:hypothetical protein